MVIDQSQRAYNTSFVTCLIQLFKSGHVHIMKNKILIFQVNNLWQNLDVENGEIWRY